MILILNFGRHLTIIKPVGLSQKEESLYKGTLIKNTIFQCRQMYVDTCKGKLNRKTQNSETL